MGSIRWRPGRAAFAVGLAALALALAVVVALVAGPAGGAGRTAGAVGSEGREPPDTAAGEVAGKPDGPALRAKTIRIPGVLRFGRLLARPPKLSEAQLRARERGFAVANPAGTRPDPAQVTRPDDPPLEAGDAAEPVEEPRRGVAPPDPRRPAQPGPTTIAPRAGASAANDLEIFRSRRVIRGADSAAESGFTSQVGEPTVAGDRDTLLFTGNWNAAVSQDNGINWRFLDPANQFPASDGGFCCDQVALSHHRKNYSLVFWVLQYANDGTDNRIRLAVFQGRNELREQANFCTYDIRPGRFGLPNQRWFDFEMLATTGRHLYISTNAYSIPAAGGTAAYQDSIVMRMGLNDLDPSDRDSCPSANIGFWDDDATDYRPALTKGAANVMYWGYHGDSGRLKIWRAPDGEGVAYPFERDVPTFNYASRSGTAATCPTSDGLDPCGRLNSVNKSAWRAGDEIVWAWDAREDPPDQPFPYTIVSRFRTGSVDKIDDHFIWNPSFAWVNAFGVRNSQHDVGLTLFSMGGNRFPRPAVAIVDPVTPNYQPLSNRGVVDSTSGTSGRWGDFYGINRYHGCSATWALGTQSQRGADSNDATEHRFVWFGREKNGCADLLVEAVAFAPASLAREERLTISETTRNVGSGPAGASRTRFYLSRDTTRSSGDVRLLPDARHTELARSESQGRSVEVAVPLRAAGAYYVIACADGPDEIAEITNQNNCTASAATVTVPGLRFPLVVDRVHVKAFTVVARGKRLTVLSRAQRTGTAAEASRTQLTYWLSPSPALTSGAALLATADAPALRRGNRNLSARVPSRLRAGDYYVIGCAGGTPRQPPPAVRCLTAEHVVHVRPRS
ncbi:MAG TPA: CARDB domain-containing protein [Solirubrobacteraceae bacterium]|nr:CARDB domain-containing protein [Solirubrobacteraceae bacterium]